MRLKHLQNLTRINVLKRQQFADRRRLYSSDILNQAVKILFYDWHSQAKHALLCLLCGRPQAAAEYLKPQKTFLSIVLSAHCKPKVAYKYMQTHKKIWRNNPQYAVYFPLLAHKLFDTAVFVTEIVKIKVTMVQKFAPNNVPYVLYGKAFAHLQEGDMLSASHSASVALKMFQKLHYSAEEAECYLLLGEIYRLSCVNEIAQTMVETAVEIYKKQNLSYSYAHATAVLGMLMFFQNRVDKAKQLYSKALELTKSSILQADIQNQIALAALSENNLASAKTALNKALKQHQQQNNEYGLAYSLQLVAHIAFAEKKYNRSAKYATQAGLLYQKSNNHSAYCECLYLQANSLYKMQKYNKAEILLRQLLAVLQEHSNSFHASTAYSLLALIFLQLGDLNRAKALLMQSVALEQQNNRCIGLAADYANLALIAQMTNQPTERQKNLQAAAEYAQKSGNNELIALIENKLKTTT